MPTINGKVCVVNGKPVDKVYSGGMQVYGRNLLMGVDKTIRQSPSVQKWISDVDQRFVEVGKPLCSSLFINNAPHAGELLTGFACCVIQAKNAYGQILVEKVGNSINFDADGISQVSLVVPDAAKIVQVFIRSSNMAKNAYYGYPKVEFGSVATPWTPAPEDVGVVV